VPRSGAEGPLLRGGRSQCLAAADVRGLARPLAFLQQPTSYIRLGSSVLCAARPVMADPLASRAADGADGPPLRRHATHLFIRTRVGHALDGKGVAGDRGDRRTLPGERFPERTVFTRFITLLGGAASWPLAGLAQETGKVRRIGFAAMLLGLYRISCTTSRSPIMRERLDQQGVHF
jgi:hypothetical protein